ncbi:MAG: hypothetical protein U0822_01640 [Anaerolineae bacterium]
MTLLHDKGAWQRFRPFAPPVIYSLSLAAGLLLLSLFAYGMGLAAQARGDAFADDPSCAATSNAQALLGVCRTEQGTVENPRLGMGRGPTPGFDVRLGDGSSVRVDLPHGNNDAIQSLAAHENVKVQIWQGLATLVWMRGRAYATSDNPLQQADAWLTGARLGAFALWLPLLAAGWLALRGWILSREPTYD